MRIIIFLVLLFFSVPSLAQDMLCPDVKDFIAQTPNSTQAIQSDVDLIKLCVERATLLKQLDEIALKRKEILNKVRAPTIDKNFMSIPIPQLSATALSDIEALAQIDTQEPIATKVPSWMVRRISGQNQNMSAQLIDSNGNIVNIVRGDILPNGQMVESITSIGVSVSLNGKIETLEWEKPSDKVN